LRVKNASFNGFSKNHLADEDHTEEDDQLCRDIERCRISTKEGADSSMSLKPQFR
jgi:hypothetical protein